MRGAPEGQGATLQHLPTGADAKCQNHRGVTFNAKVLPVLPPDLSGIKVLVVDDEADVI
jgi:hypothetical protein